MITRLLLVAFVALPPADLWASADASAALESREAAGCRVHCCCTPVAPASGHEDIALGADPCNCCEPMPVPNRRDRVAATLLDLTRLDWDAGLASPEAIQTDDPSSLPSYRLAPGHFVRGAPPVRLAYGVRLL